MEARDKSLKESGYGPGDGSTVPDKTVMADTLSRKGGFWQRYFPRKEPYAVLEGSLYWPSKAAYHVTTWMSDGSTRESWRPGPAIPRPMLSRWL